MYPISRKSDENESIELVDNTYTLCQSPVELSGKDFDEPFKDTLFENLKQMDLKSRSNNIYMRGKSVD